MEITINGIKYQLTDCRVDRYDEKTGTYIDSGLEFKHDEPEYRTLIELLWSKYFEKSQ